MPPGGNEAADARIQGFTFTQTKGDIVQWKVEAQQARLRGSKASRVESCPDYVVRGPRQRAHVVGRRGNVGYRDQEFHVGKPGAPIVVETDSGYIIRTNHLNWIDKQREIHTSDPVTIDGHGLQVTGRGLLGKLDTEIFQVLDDVHVDVASTS